VRQSIPLNRPYSEEQLMQRHNRRETEQWKTRRQRQRKRDRRRDKKREGG